MKIKAIIIDDNKASINLLTKMLEEFFKTVEVIASFTAVKMAIETIENEQPDIVFLDVEMPGENGLKLFEYISIPKFETIFISAYKEYAIDAFRVGSIDYLTKPINPEELKEALKRVTDKMTLRGNNTHDVKSRIAIHSNSGMDFISISNILHCEANDNYTFVHILKKKFVVSKPLKYFQQLLEPYGFFRTSRSHLVNLKHIKSITGGRKNTAILKDESSIPISSERKKELLNLLSDQDIINLR